MELHCGHRERLRGRFKTGGPGSLTDVEILELLLFYALPRRDVRPLAEALLRRFGGLAGLMNASRRELESVPGVGARTAMLLAASCELTNRAREEQERDTFLPGPVQARAFFLPRLRDRREEVVYCACLDGQRRLLGLDLLEGSLLKGAMDLAVSHRSRHLILARNHLGASALPVERERLELRALAASLRQMDVELVDALIAAGEVCLSLAETGILKPPRAGRYVLEGTAHETE